MQSAEDVEGVRNCSKRTPSHMRAAMWSGRRALTVAELVLENRVPPVRSGTPDSCGSGSGACDAVTERFDRRLLKGAHPTAAPDTERIPTSSSVNRAASPAGSSTTRIGVLPARRSPLPLGGPAPHRPGSASPPAVPAHSRGQHRFPIDGARCWMAGRRYCRRLPRKSGRCRCARPRSLVAVTRLGRNLEGPSRWPSCRLTTKRRSFPPRCRR